MSPCSTITFQVAKVPKTLAKHISTNFPSKLLHGTDIFTLSYVYVEYEKSISVGIFEMIMVLK